ncbi:MAG: imidazoleglycerol-phosphate dehydratase HisB [Candidatus Hadarchaeia archaeon]
MRKGAFERETEETTVRVRLNLDGNGDSEVETGIEFFDHLLESFSKHGRIDLTVESGGDFEHHIAEDTMIALGKALLDSLGEREGIRRMGSSVVPMDDALALVAIDLGGRVYSDVEVDFNKKRLEDLNTDLFRHLLITFSDNSNSNLHVKVLRGENDHHKAEAVFKALGVAISEAVAEMGGGVPSTKGVVD